MTTHFRRLFAMLVLLAVVAVSFAASAGSGAQAFIEERQSKLAALVKAPKSAANDQKIEKIFDEMLDYEVLARESLDRYWKDRSEAERKDFQCVLRHLVSDAYRTNLKKTIGYEVTFEGEVAAKSGVLVKTVAKSRKNARAEPVSIDYVVVKAGDRYRVHDIVTEGSSLVGNYRSQFRRIIKKEGFAELISRMKKKLAENGTPAACG